MSRNYSSIFLFLVAEAPTCFEAGRDLDERRFTLLPRISFDPAQLRVEQFVEPSILLSFLYDLYGSADQ